MFRILLGNCYYNSKVKLVFFKEYVSEEVRFYSILGCEVIFRWVY